MLDLNRIYNMDCLEGMKQIDSGSTDLILTSPPYNIGKEYEKKISLNKYIQWQKDLIAEYFRILDDCGSIVYQVGNYVTRDLKGNGSVYPLDCVLFSLFIDAGFTPRNRIIWTFGHGLNCTKRLSGRHETALWFSRSGEYTFNLDSIRVPQKYPNKRAYKGINKGELSCNPLGKNPGDVWDIPNIKNNNSEKTEHPCQFPLELATRFIKVLSNEGDLIIDPFIGSGTTAKACKNRNFIGFETSKKYCEIANRRTKCEVSG